MYYVFMDLKGESIGIHHYMDLLFKFCEKYWIEYNHSQPVLSIYVSPKMRLDWIEL